MTPLKRLLTGSVAPVILREPVSFTLFFAGSAYAFTIPAVLWYVGTTLVTSWALKALGPKPDFSGTRGLLTNALDGTAPQQYVYGRVRKGGTITFYESTGNNNEFLHMIICLAGHQVQSIGNIYINDEIVTVNSTTGFVTSAPWNSKIRIKKLLGSDAQVVDPDLAAETSADTSFRGRGIAYIYARLEYDQDVFTNGIPNITAVVDGKRVFNPSTGATAFSRNAALCIRDYVTDERGMGDTSIDDTMLIASRLVCDENVTLAAGGTEKRYEVNGVISSATNIGDNLQSMLTACAGTLFWGQGEWKLKVGYYTPPVKTFTLDDLRGPVTLQTRVSMSEIFNAVQGTFNDAAQDYVTVDYPKITSIPFEVEDGNVKSELDLELPFTTSSAMAQRIAKMTLFRGREQMIISADFGLSALDVQVGDIVALTVVRYGWSAKVFEVIGWKFYQDTDSNELKISMNLRETSSAAFDWLAEEEAIISNNPNLPDPYFVPAISIALTQVSRLIYEKLTNTIVVNITASAFFIDRVEVQFKPSADTNWKGVGVGAPGRYEIIDVGDGNYDVRARAYNQIGVRGDWVYYNLFQVSGVNAPPQDVTGAHGYVSGGTIVLEWTPVPDADLSHYMVRYAIEESGATFANATTAVDKVARPGSSVIIPARPGTYMIRAVDKTGVSSPSYASVVLDDSAFEQFAVPLSLTDSPAFAGSKTNCSVVSGALRITSGLSGTYQFSNYINTGAARRVRARTDVTLVRHSTTLALFDSIVGLFDSQPGLFDNFTGNSDLSDIDVVMFIRSTNTDPTASPTWSPWTIYKGGDFFGWAFQFKIDLVSQTAGATPSITALTARVWHN